MGIINLKTSLKDLKYTTKPPYVTKEVGDEVGGKYPQLIEAVKDDTLRLTNYLADYKNSAEFVAKMIGFQRMNPLTESGEMLRTWTPLSIISQTQATLTGKRFVGFGLSPFINSDLYTYSNKVKNQQTNDNRLVKLQNKLFVDNSNVIDSYNGGSQSILGLGSTTILRDVNSDTNGELKTFLTTEQKSSDQIQRDTLEKDSLKTVAKDILYNNDNLSKTFSGKTFERYNSTKPNSVNTSGTDSWSYQMLTSKEGETITIEDYRAKISTLINPETNKPYVEGYAKFNMEKRIGLSKTDNTIGNLPPYYSNSAIGGDNKTKIYDKRLDESDVVNPSSDWFSDQTRDLIRFRFQILDNDNPNYGTFLVFRASLTGFSDTYSREDNSFGYMGRAEKFYTYQNTDRSLNFNFKIHANSKSEMRTMWQKLNTLASSTYGDYKKNKLRGTFHKLTVGDYLENQPCIISNLSYTVPDDASWVIALNTQNESLTNGISDDEYTLPMTIEVSMSIKPIHNFLPKNSISDSFFVLPNEKLKSDNKSNLGWISKDMKKLSDAIASNKVATKVEYTSQYKTKEFVKKENLTNQNTNSINNAVLYRSVI